MASAGRAAAAAPPALPPAIRERLIIVDDFLPIELAEAMRLGIDEHFANPQRHAPPTHQVWNYWYVPELYAYLRTQPEKVIGQSLVAQFGQRLAAWSTQTLGLARVTHPYLSLYVPGCRQNLHNDSVNGRLGFVYSLTRDVRLTTGGETIVHHEGDPFRNRLAQPGAGRSFFDAVAPTFNRLVVFDDRMPHAVERIEGSMDPREGRFVLHGHISESGPGVAGALAPEVAVELARQAFQAFTAANFVEGYHGPLTVRLDIAPSGRVSACRALLDRVIHPDPADRRWAALLADLIGRFGAIEFPAAAGPTELVVPISFGALLPE